MFAYQPKNPRLAREHETARQLRYLGATIKVIARHLGVSESTVNNWVRDIELLPRHREANLKRGAEFRGEAWRERCREQRSAFQEDGRRRARRGESLHVTGCMLCWAEGSKTRNTVQFSNSDPAMLKTFVRFLRDCFAVTNNQVRLKINAYTSEARSIEVIEAYWLDLLELPTECARKHIVNHYPTSSSGKKANRLPNGVCVISVAKSTWLVQHIYGAIQEYAGFEDPTLLDGRY